MHGKTECKCSLDSRTDCASSFDWQALPRLLWELGNTCPGVSQLALQLLLDAFRSAPPGGTLSCAMQVSALD